MARSRSETGFIYVISASNGHVKIGKASLPYERFSNHQCSSPLMLTLEYVCECRDPRGVEISVHQALDAFRTHREWFDVSTEVAIAEVRAALAALGLSTIVAPHRSEKKRWDGSSGALMRIFSEISEIAVAAD